MDSRLAAEFEREMNLESGDDLFETRAMIMPPVNRAGQLSTQEPIPIAPAANLISENEPVRVSDSEGMIFLGRIYITFLLELPKFLVFSSLNFLERSKI